MRVANNKFNVNNGEVNMPKQTKKTNKQTKESAGCKLLMLPSHIQSVKANM